MITAKKLDLAAWGWLGYGLLAAIVMYLFTEGGVRLSPDSINYLSIAKTIHVGRWTEVLVGTWPPFFPMSIALVSSLGLAGEESARIMSVVVYSALVMAIFFMAKATAGRLVAHLSSVSMLFFAPLLFVYSFCWSETVYIALSAVSLLTLERFYESTAVKARIYLICAAVFVGFALLTRYAGVALLLAGFLIILARHKVKVNADKIKSLALFGVISCAPLAVYLISCLHYKGRFPGYGAHTMPSVWENAISFFSTIYHDFLTFDLRFANASLFPYVVSWQPTAAITILGKVTGIILVFLLMTYLLLKLFKDAARSQIVPITYVACYSLFLIFLTSTYVPISLATRFCSPIYPFMIVLAFFVVIRVCTSAVQRKARLLFWGASILAVLAFWSIQLGSSVNVFMQRAPTEAPMVEQPDITGDGIFDLSDVMYLVSYLFRGGPPPRPLQNANVNCDGSVNAGDVVYLISYIYRGGPPPCNLEDH